MRIFFFFHQKKKIEPEEEKKKNPWTNCWSSPRTGSFFISKSQKHDGHNDTPSLPKTKRKKKMRGKQTASKMNKTVVVFFVWVVTTVWLGLLFFPFYFVFYLFIFISSNWSKDKDFFLEVRVGCLKLWRWLFALSCLSLSNLFLFLVISSLHLLFAFSFLIAKCSAFSSSPFCSSSQFVFSLLKQLHFLFFFMIFLFLFFPSWGKKINKKMVFPSRSVLFFLLQLLLLPFTASAPPQTIRGLQK